MTHAEKEIARRLVIALDEFETRIALVGKTIDREAYLATMESVIEIDALRHRLNDPGIADLARRFLLAQIQMFGAQIEHQLVQLNAVRPRHAAGQLDQLKADVLGAVDAFRSSCLDSIS